MISETLVQLLLSFSLIQVFPSDVALVEQQKKSAVLQTSPTIYHATSMVTRTLPVARPQTVTPIKVDPTSLGVLTTAVSAMVVDRTSGMVLYEKGLGEERSIGSMTKLMTALVFLEGKPNLDSRASLVSDDVRAGGVQHILLNDEVRVRDLLEASLVGSDNTATTALVRLSGLTPDVFIKRMNEKAKELGMVQTMFVDPTGLSAENRSITSDLVKMLDTTMRNSLIREITEMPSVTVRGASGRSYIVKTTNELLDGFLNEPPYKILGGKTGFLPEAGYCFGAVVSENGGNEIIVVVLGSGTKQGRFQDAKALAAWTYKVFDWPAKKET